MRHSNLQEVRTFIYCPVAAVKVLSLNIYILNVFYSVFLWEQDENSSEFSKEFKKNIFTKQNQLH